MMHHSQVKYTTLTPSAVLGHSSPDMIPVDTKIWNTAIDPPLLLPHTHTETSSGVNFLLASVTAKLTSNDALIS